MRVFTTLVFFFIFAIAAAQPGTIRVVKPDTVTPQPPTMQKKIPLVWLGYEHLGGINRFGQAFWPLHIDESKLQLVKGWGMTAAYHCEPHFWSGVDLYARTGLRFVKTHVPERSIGLPFVAGLRFNPLQALPVGVQAEIGGCNFFPRGDIAFAGKTFLETGLGINVDLLWRHKNRAICIPVIQLNYKTIGAEKFLYFNIEFPLIQYKKRVPFPVPAVPAERL